jgi:hypothetical protein
MRGSAEEILGLPRFLFRLVLTLGDKEITRALC